MEKNRSDMPIDIVRDYIAAKLECDPAQVSIGARKLFAQRLIDHHLEYRVHTLLSVPDLVGDELIQELLAMTPEQIRFVLSEAAANGKSESF